MKYTHLRNIFQLQVKWAVRAFMIVIVVIGGYSIHAQEDTASDTFQTYMERGTANIELGDYWAAVADFTQAIALNPTSSEAYIRRGEAYAYLMKFEALADLDRAIELDPQSSEAYMLRGYVLDYLHEYQAAEASYSTAIELWDNNAEAYFMRADYYMSHDRYEDALADYARITELDSNYAGKAYVNSGLINLELERYGVAIANFTAAIELDANYTKAYVNRGYAYVKLGDAYTAMVDLNHAIELDPEYALAYFYRALAYAQLGSNVDVIADYWQAVGLNPSLYYVIPPEFPAAFITHGIYLYQTGHYEEAAQHLVWGVHLDPQNAEGYFFLGHVAYQLGEIEQAIWIWQEAEKLGYPLPAEVQQLMA